MGWKRDPNVTIPQIWRQFERKDKKTGEVMKFQIQDATFDMIPDITKIMLEFLKEEPVAQCFGKFKRLMLLDKANLSFSSKK